MTHAVKIRSDKNAGALTQGPRPGVDFDLDGMPKSSLGEIVAPGGPTHRTTQDPSLEENSMKKMIQMTRSARRVTVALLTALPLVTLAAPPQAPGTAKGAKKGPINTMTPIGGDPGGPTGGSTGGTSTPPPSGITLNSIILGASSSPSTVDGAVSSLSTTSSFSVPWGGVVPSLQTGRIALSINNQTVNGVYYQPLPSSFTINGTGASTPAPRVVFVPQGSSTSFISGISLTQGNHSVSSLVLGRDATLIIQACSSTGFYANFDVVISSVGVRTTLSTTSWIDAKINDGAWDGDSSRRYASVVIPKSLITSNMGITVTLKNPLGTNLGRPDLFPTTMSIVPTVGSSVTPIPIVHLIPISVGGVLPSLFTNAGEMTRFQAGFKARTPFSDVKFVVAPPMAYENLVRVATSPWQQNDPNTVWKGITWYLLWAIRPETNGSLMGVMDCGTAPGQWLGTVASGMTVANSNNQCLPTSTLLYFNPESSSDICAHEFGHQSQRQHAPSASTSGQVAANPDYGYPYQVANSTVGVMFTASLIDVDQCPARGAIGSSAEVWGGHDIMSYGGLFPYNFPSDYTWNGILNYWISKTNPVVFPMMDSTQDSTISSALSMTDPVQSFQQVQGSLIAVP